MCIRPIHLTYSLPECPQVRLSLPHFVKQIFETLRNLMDRGVRKLRSYSWTTMTSHNEPLNSSTLWRNAFRIESLTKKLALQEGLLTLDEVSLALRLVLYAIQNKEAVNGQLQAFLTEAKKHIRFDWDNPPQQLEKTIITFTRESYKKQTPDCSDAILQWFSPALHGHADNKSIKFSEVEVKFFKLFKQDKEEQDRIDFFNSLPLILSDSTFADRVLAMRDQSSPTRYFFLNGTPCTFGDVDEKLGLKLGHFFLITHYLKQAKIKELIENYFPEPVDETKLTPAAIKMKSGYQEMAAFAKPLKPQLLGQFAGRIEKLTEKLKNFPELSKEEVLLLLRCVYFWNDPFRKEGVDCPPLQALIKYLVENMLVNPLFSVNEHNDIARYVEHLYSSQSIEDSFAASGIEKIIPLFASPYLYLPAPASSTLYKCCEKNLQKTIQLAGNLIQLFKTEQIGKLRQIENIESMSESEFQSFIALSQVISMVQNSKDLDLLSIFHPAPLVEAIFPHSTFGSSDEIKILKSYTLKECLEILKKKDKFTFREFCAIKSLILLPIPQNPFKVLTNTLKEKTDQKLKQFHYYSQVCVAANKIKPEDFVDKLLSRAIPYGHTNFLVFVRDKGYFANGIGYTKKITGQDVDHIERYAINPTIAVSSLTEEQKEEFQQKFFKRMVELMDDKRVMENVKGLTLLQLFPKFCIKPIAPKDIVLPKEKEESFVCSQYVCTLIIEATVKTCSEMGISAPSSLSDFGLSRKEDMRGLLPERFLKAFLKKGILTPANLSALTENP